MSDLPRTEPSLPLVPPNFEEQQRKRSALASQAFEENRRAVFDALAAIGFLDLTVEFDGEGDSGQIEGITARDASGFVALPDQQVEIAAARWDGSGTDRRMLAIGEAIETLCYALLSHHHGGWEINDGSYGLFAFDVAKREIELTHNERYVAVETSEHAY